MAAAGHSGFAADERITADAEVDLRGPASSAPTSARAKRIRWILRRIAMGVLTMLVVSIIVFIGTQALPGNPAQAILGRYATPKLVAELNSQLGLDRPLLTQYTSWLWGILHGDLGTSLAAKHPVSELIGARLVNSLALLLYVALVAIPSSIVIGVWTAIRRDRPEDHFAQTLFLGLMALPDFVVATGVVITMATTVFTLLPATSIIRPGESPFTQFEALALPVLALTVITIPFQARLVRASMVEELESEYVQMARLRGVPERKIIWRHAIPNAMVPNIQSMAQTLSYLLGGVIIIEFVFNYPGLGTLFNSSIGNRDLPVIQAVTLIFTASVVLFNLIADILTMYLTPKLRTTGGSR